MGTTSGVRRAVPLLMDTVLEVTTSVEMTPPYAARASTVRGVA